MRTMQHCLMGIRGTVRRSTDSWFVHCNIGVYAHDLPTIVPHLPLLFRYGRRDMGGGSRRPTLKPPEMYTLVKNFCLGLRRLELFAREEPEYRGKYGWNPGNSGVLSEPT